MVGAAKPVGGFGRSRGDRTGSVGLCSPGGVGGGSDGRPQRDAAISPRASDHSAETWATIAPIDGYRITTSIQERLCPAATRAPGTRASSEAMAARPERPFFGEFYDILASAISEEMARGVAKSCEFLLSKNAEFHGVDYSMLANPPGTCEKSEIAGMPGISMHLPTGCSATAGRLNPDRFGKQAPYLASTLRTASSNSASGRNGPSFRRVITIFRWTTPRAGCRLKRRMFPAKQGFTFAVGA